VIYERYSVRHPITSGHNDVYLCTEIGTWAHVAVKIPRQRQGDRTGAGQQQVFSEEVRNWAELEEHPNVVRCLYAGLRERHWFLVLEWVGEPGI